MRVAHAAYCLMEEVAERHDGVGPEEAALLKAYRRALGVRPADLEALRTQDPASLLIEGDERECEEVLRAMARVATVDGRLAGHEREHLLEVAARLGIGLMRATNLMTEAGELRRASGLIERFEGQRRGLLVGTLLILVVALGLAYAWRGPAGAAPAHGADALQSVARQGDPALVLLRVSYSLQRGGQRLDFEGEGTGFFVASDGLIVTCKHVVQPWKFMADKVRHLEQGWALDPLSSRLLAWPAGARLFDAGGLAVTEAWDSAGGSLQLVHSAPDRWVTAVRSLPGGGRHRGRYHALDNADLVLLRATGDTPQGLTLAPRGFLPAALDPVVVLGFPKGRDLIEGEFALSAPSTGEVRRVEDTLLINSDIFPGNSGGPCLDSAGRVIGVAARRAGDESLGRCLRVEHVWDLLAGWH